MFCPQVWVREHIWVVQLENLEVTVQIFPLTGKENDGPRASRCFAFKPLFLYVLNINIKSQLALLLDRVDILKVLQGSQMVRLRNYFSVSILPTSIAFNSSSLQT